MGTETKFNGYTKNGTSADDTCISKGSGSGSSSTVIPTVSLKQNGTHTNGTHINGKQQTVNGSVSANGSVEKTANNDVPFVSIRIDENDVVGGAKELLKIIRPNWNLNQVKFKKFTDGITNKLVGCFYHGTETSPPLNGLHQPDESEVVCTSSNGNGSISNGHSLNNNGNSKDTNGFEHSHEKEQQQEDNNDSGNLSDTYDDDGDGDTDSESSSTDSSSVSSSSNVVLVRVYGNKTDLLIDRKAERRNILLMHSYGFAPPLYATFINGLAYDYIPGVTLNTNNVLEPKVWRLVACRMAEMHRLVNADKVSSDCEQQQQQPIIPMVWKKTMSFLDLVPERFSDPAKHKRLEGTFLPIAKMRDEFIYLYRRLEALNSPLVFAHNDLLLGNVVYNESQQTVNFIDYEYADYNFQAFDIGNHFAEFAGVDEVDYARYPDRDFQYKWLRVYLKEYLQKSEISDDDVHRLYVQVNQFALAAHFFWTIWCLIQAEHSNIDFDYVDYAFARYREYLAKKDKYLALDINDPKSC